MVTFTQQRCTVTLRRRRSGERPAARERHPERMLPLSKHAGTAGEHGGGLTVPNHTKQPTPTLDHTELAATSPCRASAPRSSARAPGAGSAGSASTSAGQPSLLCWSTARALCSPGPRQRFPPECALFVLLPWFRFLFFARSLFDGALHGMSGEEPRRGRVLHGGGGAGCACRVWARLVGCGRDWGRIPWQLGIRFRGEHHGLPCFARLG